MLFHYIDSAAVARNSATVESTKTKRVSAWENWNSYLISIGIESKFLEGFSRHHKNVIMSGFAQAVRSGSFSKRNNGHLVEGTVATTIAHVAQTFRTNNQCDPRLDQDGKTCFILQEQLRGYKNLDGATIKQKALPLSVVRKILDLATTEKDLALAWLFIGAIFFAMRSCEYLKTNREESSKRTNIVRLRNIIFKKEGITLEHTSEDIAKADMVAITFEFQKNDKRNKTVHMFRTGDNTLCPVIAWATTVKRLIQTVPGVSKDTTVCSYWDNGAIRQVNSTYAISRIRSVVELIGENELGFTRNDVGLHSIRSGGAMAMFLSGVSEIIIQRIGRWESFAFLEYIREQVENFTYGVSKKMLDNEIFHHINEKNLPRLDDSDKNVATCHKGNGVSSGNSFIHHSYLRK